MSQPADYRDPRSLRSRERIIRALRAELRAGRSLTIAAVTGEAKVTRQTFYNNFDSLEEAGWFALLEDFNTLLVDDIQTRWSGASPDFVGLASLRKIVELLRAESSLSLLANGYRDEAGLTGLAAVMLSEIRRFRAEFGDPASPLAQEEDLYTATGLCGLLTVAATGDASSTSIARAAYALLPEWMRQPRL
ncbi:TetR/AcrR family transcriptional regulator [Frondihabitans cladoniiphilus]|uniref:HTH tetR-type domain-containing protein n=1 Tax=Frondihabitans cladoniiphilus TaxID=715785 RepID=A0ABP8W8B4_9MICO